MNSRTFVKTGRALMHFRNKPYARMLAEFWRRYRKDKPAVAGLLILAFLVLVGSAASVIAPGDPLRVGEELLVPPSSKYLMGTDNLGRDVLRWVVHGSRISLLVGFLAAITSTAIGIAVGSISGYYGGKLDDLLMRLTEIFQVIPRFFLAMLIVALFGAAVINVIFVIAIVTWPVTARLVRAEFMTLRETEFVLAARAVGASDRSLIFGDILPNVMPPVIVNGSLQVGAAILLEAGLSFLGLGDPNIASWGMLLNTAQKFLVYSWWVAVFPGIAIFASVLAINLVGDGLNDALNPRLKEK